MQTKTPLIDSELEQAAFCLFTRTHSPEFRRALCYVVARSLDGSTMKQVNNLVHQLSRSHQYVAEDVKCALAVLKSPFAFDSLAIWTREAGKQSCRYTGNPLCEAWLQEIEQKYPHVAKLLEATH